MQQQQNKNNTNNTTKPQTNTFSKYCVAHEIAQRVVIITSGDRTYSCFGCSLTSLPSTTNVSSSRLFILEHSLILLVSYHSFFTDILTTGIFVFHHF